MTAPAKWRWMAVMLLLVGPSAMAKVKPDWFAVQTVPPGKAIAVVFYKDSKAGLPANARIKSRFSSVSDDSITLMSRSGESCTLKRQAVRKVSG